MDEGDEIYANEYDVSDSDLINGGKSTSRQIQPLIQSTHNQISSAYGSR